MIPTLPSRRELLARLLRRLRPQLVPGVAVLILETPPPTRNPKTAAEIEENARRSVGAKRNYLIRKSTASWLSMIDDDDLVPSSYVSKVLAVIDSDTPPDVVGFRLRYFVEGTVAGYAIHSYDAAKLPPPPNAARGWERHERQPNHLNPVRREFALRVGFKPLNFGEDGDYARRLAALKPRPRETFIDEELYQYLFRPRKDYPAA